MKDELELAQHAHAASSKSSVDAVLARVSAAGNSLVSLLSGLLAAVLILYSGIVLYDTFYIESSAANTPYEMLRYKPAELIDDNLVPTAGVSTLASINRDYRAWLTMYDTNIDYAVMQGPDDLYYATRDIYGQVSTTGAIYLAAANSGDCSDSYNLIYGHHMDNQAMFGGLDAFRDEAYFNSHREGTLVSASGVYDLRTFAYYGQKVWHSNQPGRKVVWRCNRKYSKDKSAPCTTPALTEETIKALFIKAADILYRSKTAIIEETRELAEMLADTSAIDEKIEQTDEERTIVVERNKALIRERAASKMTTEEFDKKASALDERYRKADARLTRLKEERESRVIRSKEIQCFVESLRSQQEPIAVWNEQAWNLLVTQVTIRSDGSAEFLFRGENTITVRAD